MNRSTAAALASVLVLAGPAATAAATVPLAASAAPTQWKDAVRIAPDELARLLRAPGAERPAIFQVGFRVLYDQAHIPGAVYAGPGRDPAAVEALKKAAAPLGKAKPIVLYCGCCPWQHCPNMQGPWEALRAAGFTNVKVLYIPQNFGADWVRKGYPVEGGDAR